MKNPAVRESTCTECGVVLWTIDFLDPKYTPSPDMLMSAAYLHYASTGHPAADIKDYTEEEWEAEWERRRTGGV